MIFREGALCPLYFCKKINLFCEFSLVFSCFVWYSGGKTEHKSAKAKSCKEKRYGNSLDVSHIGRS